MRRVLKPLRLTIALFVLAGFTGAFLDFRGLLPVSLVHWLAALQFTPALLAGLAGGAAVAIFALLLLGTLLFGRVYCSVLCPLGLLQDAVARLARWLRPRHRPLPYTRERTGWRLGVLGVVMAAALAGFGGVALTHSDPYGTFGRIVSVVGRPLLTLLNNAAVSVARPWGTQAIYRVPVAWPTSAVIAFALPMAVLVGVLAWRRGRLYCNTLCPVGTVLGLLSRFAALRVVIDRAACTKCATCLHVCKAQCLNLRDGRIDASRCVACFNCLSSCPQQGIRYAWAWRKPAPRARVPVAAASSIPDPQRRALLAGAAGWLLAPMATLRADGPAPAPAGPPAMPPGAQDVDRFLDRCIACQLCVAACPTGVLRPAEREYGFAGLAKPRLDFQRSFCNYECRRCAEVCPTGAIVLLPLADKQLTSIGVAKFEQSRCIVETDGTDCAACSEHCPTKAVNTVPFRTNLRLPRVEDDLCIGCGACEYACPVRPQRAITVSPRPVHQRARRAVEEKAKAPKTGDFPF